MEPRVRIVCADRQTLFRDGLRTLLDGAGFLVIGEASDGVDALRFARELEPDILLAEWNLPRMAGAVLLRELSAARLSTRVIVLTETIEETALQTAIEHGARGLVLKASGCTVLFSAIRAVMSEQYWFSGECAGDLVHVVRRLVLATSQPKAKTQFGLTPREIEIVSAVATGLCNKEIAQKLTISERTVKHHLTNIFGKVGVSNRLELALFALGHGLSLL